MTREQYIKITGVSPEETFGKDWLINIEELDDDGSNLCMDCLGTKEIVNEDGIVKKCHCWEPAETDDDSDED